MKLMPYYGGKSIHAPEVWKRFGKTTHYIEPFCGELSVLFACQHETYHKYVNDKDFFLVNFWRAVKLAPDELFEQMDMPIIETDIYLMHDWLLKEGPSRLKPIETDLNFYDIKVAAWWIFGMCCSLGGGNKWCEANGAWKIENGVWVKGKPGLDRSKPSGARGYLSRSVPRNKKQEMVREIAKKLKDVTILSGDWKRVLSGYFIPTDNVAIFFDPPYEGYEAVYAADSKDSVQSNADTDHDIVPVTKTSIASEVRAWAIDKPYKMAICGFGDEHKELEQYGWDVYCWVANGGYANQSGNSRRHDEKIWFSPACLKPSKQLSLF